MAPSLPSLRKWRCPARGGSAGLPPRPGLSGDALMTTTTDGAPGRASRVRTPDAQFLRESSRRARERAEELLVRSATVLARSGDLRGLIGERAALVDPEEVPDLLR